MNDIQIHSKITLMEIDVLQALYQRTLEKYTAGPSIDRARLFFLLLPFFDGKQWSEDVEDSAKTVAIVYAALQAHDQVKEESPISKSQQLTVLAGDFYSGIYYQMLSNTNNIKLIQLLASGIIGVSEKKATLFEKTAMSANDVESAAEVIETRLLTIFYDHYGYSHYKGIAVPAMKYVYYSNQLDYLRDGVETNILRKLNMALPFPLYSERWILDKLDSLHIELTKALDIHPMDYRLKNFMLHQITPHQHLAEQLTREG
ncbi:heptaprenyl diphosphate synthase component 1 [Planococcus salinarum]|uniref:heptaprenyl diphosphate synthase component 1 n=1 Tax=Planococcus salinarum TaxID=622695 RepID=UPI000E3B9AB1|nr:heptaprenyl diphosphate synthase component 1 [Planococcus salinarum]TAA72543.1 heptaprenyl diphosphate synthase [Planococcus salinarum]